MDKDVAKDIILKIRCHQRMNPKSEDEAFKEAICAINKQIGAKPEAVGSSYLRKHYQVYNCPVCKRMIVEKFNCYCNHCGQKIDWSK
jgi:hypothetical protein